MSYKRILTIQDISCVGQCSMTVALPILSAWGHECCILPTAVLSTHTGGFGKPAVVHFDGAFDGIIDHWKENGITFDAVLVGYLGSLAAVEAAGRIMEERMSPGGVAIVDPAMGDHGKLYSGFDENYVRAVGALCRKADIVIPNVTEAALLTGMPCRETPDEGYVEQLLTRLGPGTWVLTGVGFAEGETGVAVQTPAGRQYYIHPRREKSYHGTGDMFAACFTGALMQGREIGEAAGTAADFVCRCIEETERDPAHWYGVKFEPVLGEIGGQSCNVNQSALPQVRQGDGPGNIC